MPFITHAASVSSLDCFRCSMIFVRQRRSAATFLFFPLRPLRDLCGKPASPISAMSAITRDHGDHPSISLAPIVVRVTFHAAS